MVRVKTAAISVCSQDSACAGHTLKKSPAKKLSELANEVNATMTVQSKFEKRIFDSWSAALGQPAS